jgi:hypothetical protein
MDNFSKMNELIMNFWNEDIMFVTQRNWKCELKKYVIVMSK